MYINWLSVKVMTNDQFDWKACIDNAHSGGSDISVSVNPLTSHYQSDIIDCFLPTFQCLCCQQCITRWEDSCTENTHVYTATRVSCSWKFRLSWFTDRWERQHHSSATTWSGILNLVLCDVPKMMLIGLSYVEVVLTTHASFQASKLECDERQLRGAGLHEGTWPDPCFLWTRLAVVLYFLMVEVDSSCKHI